jgi:hypothetical protein
MSLKKSSIVLSCVAGCALAVASPSVAVASPAAQVGATQAAGVQAAMVGSWYRPSERVEVVVRLEEGADRATVLASIREAVAEFFPGESVKVEYEYGYVVQGFGLSVPAGSIDVIRGVSGVQSAYYVRSNRLW